MCGMCGEQQDNTSNVVTNVICHQHLYLEIDGGVLLFLLLPLYERSYIMHYKRAIISIYIKCKGHKLDRKARIVIYHLGRLTLVAIYCNISELKL